MISLYKIGKTNLLESKNFISVELRGLSTDSKPTEILDRKIENGSVFIEIDTDIVPFEGQTACHYGNSYASVMGEGTAEIIEDSEGKKEALSILMKTQTEKDFTFTDRMASIVTVIKIHIDEFTAKKRPLPTNITSN